MGDGVEAGGIRKQRLGACAVGVGSGRYVYGG
jgi:hypothetical protein